MTERDRSEAVVQRLDVDLIQAAVVRATVAPEDFPAFVEHATGLVAAWAAERGYALRRRPLARFLRRDGELEVEVGYPVVPPGPDPGPDAGPDAGPDGVRLISLGGHPVVSVLHVGDHHEVDAAYTAAIAWMREHHLVPVAAPWEVFLDGPESAPRRTAVHLPFETVGLPRQRRHPGSDGSDPSGPDQA